MYIDATSNRNIISWAFHSSWLFWALDFLWPLMQASSILRNMKDKQCCRNCFSMNRTTKFGPQNHPDSDFFRTLFLPQIGHFLTCNRKKSDFFGPWKFFRKSDFYRTCHMLFLPIFRTKNFAVKNWVWGLWECLDSFK